MKLTRRDFAAGIAAGIVAPHVISSARAQGATIKIGMCAPVTGPAAESGGYADQGREAGARCHQTRPAAVLGKQLELIVEDDQTTNPGIVLAFSKLAGAVRHRCLPRLDPLDPGARHVAGCRSRSPSRS